MGKISKSKKTLALVMALVMAFTIVPFGAWGVIKASAESPNPNAVNFQLATELRDGQAYVIVDRNGQYMMTDDSKNMSSNTAKVNFGTFNVGMSIADVIAQGGLWEYDLTTTSNADDNGKVDAERFKRFSMLNNTQVWLDLYTNDEVHTFTADDCELGIEKRANGYWYIDRTSRGRDDRFLGFSYPDGIGYDNFCQQADVNCQGVLIYEPIETSANEINLPVTMRDFQKDNLFFDIEGNGFSLSTDENETGISNEGHYRSRFLNLVGSVDGSHRTGLTQTELRNGNLEYSPYTVIYTAHLLEEIFFTDNDTHGDIYALNNSALGQSLRSKFAYKNNNTYYKGWWMKEDGEVEGRHQLEEWLQRTKLESFQNNLANATTRANVDKYFADVLNGTVKYNSFAEAETAALKIVSGTDAKVLADYAFTVSHADQMTYAMITNDIPTFETHDVEIYKGRTLGLKDQYETLYDQSGGATMMDVAYYLLHHFFNGTNANGNYGKEVTDAAHSLQLHKVMHADGTIAYVYDSSYTSKWNENGVIKNTGLTKDDSTGVYNKKANFTPINGKGFETDANAQNYGMTLHGNGKFVYSAADKLYFKFNGDDDVFLYINGKRTKVDLGGVHGPQDGEVYLESVNPATGNTYAHDYGLVEGGIYSFDFYYMEREPVGSNLRMETNIVVTDANVLAQKKAYRDASCLGAEYTDGSTVTEGTTVYYELAVNNLDVTGGSKIDGIVLEDTTLGIKLSENEVILPNNPRINLKDMVMCYAEVDGQGNPQNGSTRVDVGNPDGTADVTKIKKFFTDNGTQTKMKPGTSLWVDGIAYTMDRDTLSATNGVFTNTMKATAKVHPVVGDGFTEKSGTDSFTMKLWNLVNKTYVTDFVSGDQGIVYKGDEVFTGADELLATSIAPKKFVLDNGSKIAFDDVTRNITYYPSDLKGADTFEFTEWLANGDKDTKKVTFVPGNNIYYDDSFTGDHGIKYTGDWKTTTGAAGAISGVGGTDVIYGNNPNFGDDVTYSGKTIHSIVGNGSKVTASLDFSGQGATVYMKTTANSGSMVAQLFKKSEDKPVRTLMVNLTGTETLNSVPAVNFLDLPYGDYEIRLTINAKAGTETYLDGIRVYLPLGSDNEYYNPSEHNAQFIEIRDNVVNVAEIDKLVDEAILGGALYIDGTSGVATLADYTKEGPKNEIYLAQNQGITFKIDGYQEGKMFVQVGARMLKGTPGKLSFDSDTATGTDITSATDMFYKVTVQPSGLVTITNTGAGVVALTNLKVTGAMAPKAKMVVSRAIADEAIEYLNTAPVAPEVPETPTEPETPVVPQNPFEKFFNDIRDFFNKLFGIK